jgi:hypothetical protein
MRLWKPTAVSTGFLSLALLAGGPAAADDKTETPKRPAGTLKAQLQQRAQAQQPTGSSSSGGAAANKAPTPATGSVRSQVQQQVQARKPTPQPTQPAAGSGSSTPTPGAFQNRLQNRGGNTPGGGSAPSPTVTPRSQIVTPKQTLPNNSGSPAGTLRDRLPNLGTRNPATQNPATQNPSSAPATTRPGQTFNPGQNLNRGQNLQSDPAGSSFRQRLQQQTDGLRQQQQQQQQGSKVGTGAGQDALRQRIETLKPQTGNLPGGNAEQARDRLKAAQEQLQNRPQGGALQNLPQGQGNLQNRLPNLGDRQPNLGDRQPNLGNRLPNPGDRQPNLQNRLPNLGDGQPKVGDRLPNVGDRQPNLGNRLPNAGDRPNLGNRLEDGFRPRVDPSRLTGERTVPLTIDKNGLLGNLKGNPQLRDQFQLGRDRIRTPEELQQRFDRLQNVPELQAQLRQSNLRVTDLSGAFQTRARRNDFTQITQTNIGRQLNLNQQFNLAIHGDVARQMNLNQQLIRGGGWARRSVVGPVWGGYTRSAFSVWYPGPGFYPPYIWMPVWSPWVAWTYWDYCLPIYDPRPFWCRPIFYDPCPPIVYYTYPVWQPLPVVSSGTWVDIPSAIVDQGFDLQLLAVRFVDPGHPEEKIGPRFRVWVRNNSPSAIGAPFNVTLVAANGVELAGELPQAGVTVPEMDADTIVPIDIRLPFDANRMNVLASGQRTPFTHLHILVDSHRDVMELDESNNGAIVARQDILPVDPAAFSTDVTAAAPESLVSLAGEGFGPEPGQLLVVVDGQHVQAEIFGWYDLGVQFKLPAINVSGPTPIDLLVVRGDGAASNPVTMSLAPQQLLGEAPPPAPAP